MGDRANIYLEMPTGYGPNAKRRGIYLYTHWAGSEWPEVLREALEFGRGRWTDDSYLARIIASRAFRDIVDEETGGGLSLARTDNEHPIIVCDLIEQVVSFADEGQETERSARYGHQPFAEYVAQAQASYPPR